MQQQPEDSATTAGRHRPAPPHRLAAARSARGWGSPRRRWSVYRAGRGGAGRPAAAPQRPRPGTAWLMVRSPRRGRPPRPGCETWWSSTLGRASRWSAHSGTASAKSSRRLARPWAPQSAPRARAQGSRWRWTRATAKGMETRRAVRRRPPYWEYRQRWPSSRRSSGRGRHRHLRRAADGGDERGERTRKLASRPSLTLGYQETMRSPWVKPYRGGIAAGPLPTTCQTGAAARRIRIHNSLKLSGR